MQKMKSIWQNPWTLTGAVLAILAILFFLSFQLIEIIAPTRNPYVGLWTFLVLPALLVIGLILIPAGYFFERRKRRRLFPEVREWPRLPQFDPNNPRHLRGLLVFVVGTLVVIPLIAVSSYQGYHYTDSTQFCGRICHSVMHPEYTTYQNSPHARLNCAACHIGPGASWFVRSKLSGLRQVWATTFNTFSRPIPTPIKDLRPARETCEQCHWPEKFFGSQLRSRVHFAPDENNTRSEIRVLVKTGGADSLMGIASGIHYHMALSQKTEYIATDRARQVIPWVRATDASGKVSVFRSDGKAPEDPPPPGEMRQFDCMDCHNRPTHIIQPPDRAINVSLEAGRMPRTLPYAKKVAVEALTEPYSAEEEATSKIDMYIRQFYRRYDPRLAELQKTAIDQTIKETQAIYRRNFFPRMKVTWRIYPENIGHMIFDGCFRCHDGRHASGDKRVIQKDCGVCHGFVQELRGPANQYAFQQLISEHPVKLEGIHATLNCTSCHTGGRPPVPTCAGCHATQDVFRRGEFPMLPGLKATPPSIMANLDCQSCHDMIKPSWADVGARCETCHEKGYRDMMKVWQDDAQAGRAKATAAIDKLKADLASGKIDADQAAALRGLTEQLQAALEQVDRAGAQHNTDFADAIYQQIVKLAEETSKQQGSK